RATINAVFETFGTPPQPGSAIQFEQFLSPPMPRYWFEKSGTPDLLQVQQDRIIHNWRKQEGELIYPSSLSDLTANSLILLRSHILLLKQLHRNINMLAI
ncbi:MAG: hypothetical protein ACXWU5_06290, partial [Rhodoplanes sp.]